MMREVLERRFGRALKEQAAGGTPSAGTAWPDLVLIDGGAGQLSAARAILQDLGVERRAAGRHRQRARTAMPAANGSTWTARAPFQLPPRDPVLYFLQRLRDEAHRFAIAAHRAGRSKSLTRSELDEVPGIGAARKRALLNHFGSARGVKQAGLAALEAAPGISRETARRIYAHFHPGVRLEGVS